MQLTRTATSEIIYRTLVDGDDGRCEVWLDGLLRWKGGWTAEESPDGNERVDPQLEGWYPISQLLSVEQCRVAFDAADAHAAAVLKGINETFADATDPVSKSWRDAAQLVLDLDRGLAEYFLDAADLFDEHSLALMPAFVNEPRVDLAGGLRQFDLGPDRTGGIELVGWTEVVDSSMVFSGVGWGARPAELIDLVDMASGTETREVITRHINAIATMGEQIRLVMNKLRSGVPISRNERERYSGYAASIVEFQRQYDAIV
ncbi:MAG: hypothetical protein J0H98_11845 [Solirubrobacterales bacterium]|nr:hypothetical protein [Solirubrobacterales bacterium]